MSFPTFLMSFAASHSGCQASTKIGATPQHTGKVHTQVCHVCALCQRRERDSKLLHFWPKRVEFRSYVDRFCIWVQNVARKVATVARFRCGRDISWVLAQSCPKMQLSHGFAVGQSIFPWFRHVGSWDQVVLLPIGLSENWFSVSSATGNDLCS